MEKPSDVRKRTRAASTVSSTRSLHLALGWGGLLRWDYLWWGRVDMPTLNHFLPQSLLFFFGTPNCTHINAALKQAKTRLAHASKDPWVVMVREYSHPVGTCLLVPNWPRFVAVCGCLVGSKNQSAEWPKSVSAHLVWSTITLGQCR